MSSNKNVNEIVSELESLGKVVGLKVNGFNSITHNGQTEIKKVIMMTYEYGHLDYPKRVSAD